MKRLLIVVDMQNDFIDGALGTKEAEAIVEKVVKKIEEWDGDIVFTLDTHFSDYLSTQEGRNLPVMHCIENTDGWQINGKVKAAAEKKNKTVGMFKKVTFGSAALAEFIKDGNYECAEFIGLCTDICVISNVMVTKAAAPEMPITVDASCCAGVTPQSHKNALEAMKMCQISIVGEE
ncbi:MAG: cysteine hydrolase [Ruminococcaceae bacterium]|nr:cysteine hydrolase [Oscillospiraceae bacterium]